MASSGDGTTPMKLRVPFNAMGDMQSNSSPHNFCLIAKDAAGNEVSVEAKPGEDFFEFVLPENTPGGKQQIQIRFQKNDESPKPRTTSGKRRGRPPKKASATSIPKTNKISGKEPSNAGADGVGQSQDSVDVLNEESANEPVGSEISVTGIRRSRRRVKTKIDDDFIIGYKAMKKEMSDDDNGESDNNSDLDDDYDEDFTHSDLINADIVNSEVAFNFNSGENRSSNDVTLDDFVGGIHPKSNQVVNVVKSKRGRKKKSMSSDPFCPNASAITSRGTARSRAPPGPVLTDPELLRILEEIQPTETLEDHFTLVSSSRGQLFQCNHCDETVRTRKKFLVHIKKHKDFNPWKCPKCPYAAPYRSVLASHLNVHSSVYPFLCKLCGKGFHYKQKLRAHMSYHTSGNIKKCPDCNLTFQNAQKLKKHAAEVHDVDLFGDDTMTQLDNQELETLVSQRSALSVGLKIDEELLAVCNLVKGAKKNILLSCMQCDYTCQSQTSFVQHLSRNHSDVRPYSCTQCSYTGKTKHSLVVHMKNHVDIKPFECLICGKAYALKYKLDIHLKGHENKREFACAHCSKAFNTKDEMNKHIKNVHSTERPFVCEVCGKSFKFKTHYKSHMVSHTGIKPYHCEVCSKNFTSRASLMNHVKNHQTQYLCEICNKTLGSHSGFMAHKRFHDPKNAEQCTCPECGKLMQSKSGLLRHQLVMHTNERPHECAICKKRFKLKIQLQGHMVSHSTVKAFKCNICGLALKRKESLRMHMFCHATVKPYKCGRCGQEYVQKKSLEIHLRVKHAGVKERCSFCGKGFNTKYLLMNHIKRKHEGELEQSVREEPASEVTVENEAVLAAACEQCKQVFLSQHSLAVHILTEHMNQKWVGGMGLAVQDQSIHVVSTPSASEITHQEACTSVAETIEIPCGEEMILISAVPSDESQVGTEESYSVTIEGVGQ